MAMPRKHYRCTVEGCSDLHHARGLCHFHYGRWYHNTSLTVPRKQSKRPVVDGKKQCRRCCEWKPLDEMVVWKGGTGGRAAVCRPCKRAENRERRAAQRAPTAESQLAQRFVRAMRVAA